MYFLISVKFVGRLRLFRDWLIDLAQPRFSSHNAVSAILVQCVSSLFSIRWNRGAKGGEGCWVANAAGARGTSGGGRRGRTRVAGAWLVEGVKGCVREVSGMGGGGVRVRAGEV